MLKLVLSAGLEPARSFELWSLNPARLPIPPGEQGAVENRTPVRYVIGPRRRVAPCGLPTIPLELALVRLPGLEPGSLFGGGL